MGTFIKAARVEFSGKMGTTKIKLVNRAYVDYMIDRNVGNAGDFIELHMANDTDCNYLCHSTLSRGDWVVISGYRDSTIDYGIPIEWQRAHGSDWVWLYPEHGHGTPLHMDAIKESAIRELERLSPDKLTDVYTREW